MWSQGGPWDQEDMPVPDSASTSLLPIDQYAVLVVEYFFFARLEFEGPDQFVPLVDAVDTFGQ